MLRIGQPLVIVITYVMEWKITTKKQLRIITKVTHVI